jgi:hypothetical protein
MAETRHFYILMTKTNMFVAVNKATLKNENRSEAFVAFITDKCMDAQWVK